jgi:hypothetical protein
MGHRWKDPYNWIERSYQWKSIPNTRNGSPWDRSPQYNICVLLTVKVRVTDIILHNGTPRLVASGLWFQGDCIYFHTSVFCRRKLLSRWLSYLSGLLPRPEATDHNRCLPARFKYTKVGSPAAIVCRGQCARAGMASDFQPRGPTALLDTLSQRCILG